MIEVLLLIIIAIAILSIGISIGKIKRKYRVFQGDIIPKDKKTFYGLLANTTRHQFREIRYGKAKIGELTCGGGRPEEKCTVWEYDGWDHEDPQRHLVCELVD